MQRLVRLLVLLAICLLVFFITREIYRPAPSSEQVSSTVLLERVRPVLKLVTVEGDFSELYDHTDTWTYNQLLAGIPSFRKRAIVRVKARVSVGYDLEGMQVTADEASHTLTLEAAPQPQVLSVEHDVDYYDLDEGLFNHFSPQELTAISAKAKQRVLDQVPQSGLYAEAEKQRDAIVQVVRALAESAGWTLKLGWEPQDGRSRLKG
ncbi:MAG: DUF4230 domain-containing protein [Bacteroidetes bacterium]|nr:DUF4230 domain-containing protein [Bacteroidota bacterium]